jgi:hypothetical protein
VEGVVDFTTLQYTFTATAGSVFAGIRQHHALAQGGNQYVFTFPDLEGFSAAGDSDFEWLHAFLHLRPDIFADYSLLW